MSLCKRLYFGSLHVNPKERNKSVFCFLFFNLNEQDVKINEKIMETNIDIAINIITFYLFVKTLSIVFEGILHFVQVLFVTFSRSSH